MKIWREKNLKTGKFEWHADFRAAKRRHSPIAGSRDEMDEIIEAIRKRARALKHGLFIEREVVTIGQLVAERSKELDHSSRSHRQILATIERFRDYFKDEQFPVEHIKSAHIRAFVQSLRAKNPKLQSSTVNTRLNAVNSLLHSAERFFPVLESWKPPRMPFESVPEDGRQRVITEEEQARLFFELRAPQGYIGGKYSDRRESAGQVRVRHTVADLFDFALLTGMRNTEARTLARKQIDLTVRSVHDARTGQDITTYGEVLLLKTKNGKKRRVPLNADSRALVERRLTESACDWLFPNTAETRPISPTVVRRILQRIAKKAGVVYGQRVEEGFVFHDSRHTAATAMLQQGSDLKTVGSILGHTDETMTMRYSHASPVSRAHAVGSLERGHMGGSAEEKRGEKKNENDK